MQTQVLTLNAGRNVTLTCYLQQLGGEFYYVRKRPAVLILPGGGYAFCSDTEADPVALPYLEAGYHAFILRYSVKEDAVWPNPIEDYEHAMSLIREKGEEWGIYTDKIAVIGFSAGGHLAACAAAMSRNRPNAAILGYPVAGEDVKLCISNAPDAIAAVDSNTCPCFIFATRNDRTVAIDNSLRLMLALDENDISFEAHIYGFGPHGFSTCRSSVVNPASGHCSRVHNWVGDSIEWLKDMFGDFCSEGLTPPRCKAHSNDDREERHMSLDCSVAHLLENPASRTVMEQAFEEIRAMGVELRAMRPDARPAVLRTTAREILSNGRLSAGRIKEIESMLIKIPNEI